MSKSLHRKFRLAVVGNPLSINSRAMKILFFGKPNLGIRSVPLRNRYHFYLYQVIPIQGDFDITIYKDNLTKNCNINMLKGIIWINMGIDLDVYNRSC